MEKQSLDYSKLIKPFRIGSKVKQVGATPLAKDIKESVPFGEKVLSSRPLTNIEQEQWYRRRIAEYGTNSMLDPLVQVGKWVGKKVAPNKITDEKFNNFLYRYQKPLLDKDREFGDKLSKIPILGKLFKTVDDVPGVMHTTDKGTEVVNTVQQQGYRASAPVDKAKKFALPVLGVLGVQQVAEIVQPPKKSVREGDALVTQAEHDTTYRSKLIEKISNVVDTNVVDKNSKLLQAADMLKRAAYEINRLQCEINKYADDNKQLTLQIIARERSNRSVRLANEMMGKGLIKKAEFNDEIDRIMDMDDNAFNLLEKTVKNASINRGSDGNKLDKLSGLFEYSSREHTSFEDELLKG